MAQFSSIQFSHSVMSNSLWPHGLQHAMLPCLSPTSGAYSNSCPSSRWCHPTISSSVVAFSVKCARFLQQPDLSLHILDSTSFRTTYVFLHSKLSYWNLNFLFESLALGSILRFLTSDCNDSKPLSKTSKLSFYGSLCYFILHLLFGVYFDLKFLFSHCFVFIFLNWIVVQSLSCVQLFVIPWTVAHQASLSFTLSWSLVKLMSIESMMPSNHLILCCLFFHLPSVFPSIRVLSSE